MNRNLLLVPSTYGLLGWGLTVFFLILNPIGMTPLSYSGYSILLYTIFILLIFTIIFMKKFSKEKYISSIKIGPIDSYIFYITTVIGLIGLNGYITDVSSFYGGVDALIYILSSDALAVRGSADEFASAYFQVSYFSWISIFLGVLIVRHSDYSILFKIAVLVVILIEVFMNLFFIDRTRPVWILFTVGIGLIFSGSIDGKKFSRNISYLLAMPALIFLSFSYAVQKFNQDLGIVGTMTAYILSGIGYLDDLNHDVTVRMDYAPLRTFMPISKFLEANGLIKNVPSDVLENRFIPFPTNVGSIHEPYISDGGIAFLVIFFPLIVAFINYIAFVGYRSKTSIGLFLWANCLFTMMISFFVPKFNSVPFYLFIMVFMISSFIYADVNPRLNKKRTGQLPQRFPRKSSH
jgi:oligosaccharide repeat unit polymerase